MLLDLFFYIAKNCPFYGNKMYAATVLSYASAKDSLQFRKVLLIPCTEPVSFEY